MFFELIATQIQYDEWKKKLVTSQQRFEMNCAWNFFFLLAFLVNCDDKVEIFSSTLWLSYFG